MAEANIPPVIPNLNSTQEAISGSSSAIFTASDRKIIKERAGEIDRARTFEEIFKEGPLTREVENEETSIEGSKNATEQENRLKAHAKMLKHSPLITPKDKFNLAENTETQSTVSPNIAFGKPTPTLNDKTAAIITELHLDPTELASKFSLSEEALHELVHKIKKLHLGRLLSNSKVEFDNLSLQIKKETLALANKDAKKWLDRTLDELTLKTAQYKLSLATSMQSLSYNPEREKDILWLKETVKRLT